MNSAGKRGIPFIVSGPSGAGKTTLYRMALERIERIRHSVSYTTRPRREGEVNGRDYRFVDDVNFDRMVKRGEFIEYATIHGHRYGTSGKDLAALLDEGLDVILEIDVQGARSLRGLLEGAVYVFVAPPSVDELRRRLSARGKDSPGEIEKRLQAAAGEIRSAGEYDYIIINDDIDRSFDLLRAVILAERSKKERVMERVRELFSSLWKRNSL